MLPDLIEILVAASGVGGLALMDSSDVRVRRWAGVVGIVGQPWWLLLTFQSGHIGHFVVSAVVTVLYARAAFRGFREAFFRLRPVQGERQDV